MSKETVGRGTGEDSVSLVPLLRGEHRPVRGYAVSHSIGGKFAVRDGRWKLVLCPGSGGWSEDDAEAAAAGKPLVQLYDMAAAAGETRNLCRERPDRVQAMVDQLKAIVARGRSTPGRTRANDTEVDIWKLDSMPGVTLTDLPCEA